MHFDYFEPQTVEEAREILDHGKGEFKPFCGGTDIVIQLRRGVVRYRGLVNLKRIPGLSEWYDDAERGLTIGACTVMRDLETARAVREGFPSLWESLRVVGSLQLRNLASVGGNLCNASPSADTAPSLIALGAGVRVCNGASAAETMPLEGFFQGPGAASLGPSGLLLSINVPHRGTATGDAFERFTPRSAMDIAVASAAARVALDSRDGRIREARVALGAVAPTPRRAPSAEALLRGQEPTPKILAEAGRLAVNDCSPIDDIRASAAYRRELVRVLVKRVLQRSVTRAGGATSAGSVQEGA